MEKENIIMQYISSWNWFILAMIMFVSSFIVIKSGGLFGSVMFFAFMISFILALIISWMRRKRLLDMVAEEDYYGETKDD